MGTRWRSTVAEGGIPMHVHALGSAVALLTLAVLILGTQWSGFTSAGGSWVDAVSLQQWALFLAGTGAVGLAVGARLRSARHRWLAILPTCGWLGVQLWGPLGPIPVVIYLAPTLVVWFLALGARTRRSGGWHAP